jgi:hypothetical protein
MLMYGFAVTQLDEALRYKSDGSELYSRWGHCYFSLAYLFRPHYDPGVDLPSNRNGAKAADYLNHVYLQIVWKLWESQTPEACPGLYFYSFIC